MFSMLLKVPGINDLIRGEGTKEVTGSEQGEGAGEHSCRRAWIGIVNEPADGSVIRREPCILEGGLVGLHWRVDLVPGRQGDREPALRIHVHRAIGLTSCKGEVADEDKERR